MSTIVRITISTLKKKILKYIEICKCEADVWWLVSIPIGNLLLNFCSCKLFQRVINDSTKLKSHFILNSNWRKWMFSKSFIRDVSYSNFLWRTVVWPHSRWQFSVAIAMKQLQYLLYSKSLKLNFINNNWFQCGSWLQLH